MHSIGHDHIRSRNFERQVFLNCTADIVTAFQAALPRWFPECGERRYGEIRIVCTQSLKDARLSDFSKDSGCVLLIGILRDLVTLGPLQSRGRSVCLDCLRYWACTAGWDDKDCGFFEATPPEVVSTAIQLGERALAEFNRIGTVADQERSLLAVDV